MNTRVRISARVRATAIGLSMSWAIASCGGGDAGGYTTGPGGQTNPGNGNPSGGTGGGSTVTLVETSFTPQVLTVSPGTTVTWKWSPCSGDGYSACPTHNVAFDDGSNITSGTQNSGDFQRAFATAGTYHYHCTIHGSGMSGQVVVK